MKKGFLVLVAVLVIGGGAYMLMNKNDEKSENTTNGATETVPAQSDAKDQETATATAEVVIEDLAFSPASITVKKGTKVTWTNKDSVSHTVTSSDGGPLNSGLLTKNASYSVTFDTVGSFDYFCEPHPSMTGTVTVTE